MATRGGYAPDVIWEMNLDDAMALLDYWARVPPLRDLTSIIAQMLGYEASSASRPVEGEGTPALDVPGEFED